MVIAIFHAPFHVCFPLLKYSSEVGPYRGYKHSRKENFIILLDLHYAVSAITPQLHKNILRFLLKHMMLTDIQWYKNSQ